MFTLTRIIPVQSINLNYYGQQFVYVNTGSVYNKQGSVGKYRSLLCSIDRSI